MKGDIPKVRCFEAGHPVPDENSFRGTQAALDLVSDLKREDTVIFLLSGGGSALFEKPLISGQCHLVRFKIIKLRGKSLGLLLNFVYAEISVKLRRIFAFKIYEFL